MTNILVFPYKPSALTHPEKAWQQQYCCTLLCKIALTLPRIPSQEPILLLQKCLVTAFKKSSTRGLSAFCSTSSDSYCLLYSHDFIHTNPQMHNTADKPKWWNHPPTCLFILQPIPFPTKCGIDAVFTISSAGNTSCSPGILKHRGELAAPTEAKALLLLKKLWLGPLLVKTWSVFYLSSNQVQVTPSKQNWNSSGQE